jgi:hypothetical protein
MSVNFLLTVIFKMFISSIKMYGNDTISLLDKRNNHKRVAG